MPRNCYLLLDVCKQIWKRLFLLANLWVRMWKALAIGPQENVSSRKRPFICAGSFDSHLAAIKDGFCTTIFNPPSGFHLLKCEGAGLAKIEHLCLQMKISYREQRLSLSCLYSTSNRQPLEHRKQYCNGCWWLNLSTMIKNPSFHNLVGILPILLEY